MCVDRGAAPQVAMKWSSTAAAAATDNPPALTDMIQFPPLSALAVSGVPAIIPAAVIPDIAAIVVPAIVIPAAVIPAIIVAACAPVSEAATHISTADTTSEAAAAIVATAAVIAAAAAVTVTVAAAAAATAAAVTLERVSSGSSADWDGLSAILGGGSSDDDEELEPSSRSKQEYHAQIESRENLTHSEFSASFRHRRPVLLRGFANDWPALSRWSDAAHLRGLLPGTSVLVLRASDGRRFLKCDCTREQRPFSEVTDHLFEEATKMATPVPEAAPSHSARIYARAPLRAGLRAECKLASLAEFVNGANPKLAGDTTPGEKEAHCNWHPDEFNEANCGVWLGSAGCVTPLHYDLCHGFLVGVLGMKRVTYYAPEDFTALYPRKDQPELSTVDLDAWRQGEGPTSTEAGASQLPHAVPSPSPSAPSLLLD